MCIVYTCMCVYVYMGTRVLVHVHLRLMSELLLQHSPLYSLRQGVSQLSLSSPTWLVCLVSLPQEPLSLPSECQT